ncbi:helix-turn-helix domain-containing protein [uncultured Roseovarius sp.]|uniref:GlxA family transcriptional regulator n=1 Tax=uncultured Roseovarius sp. TaxID=293344 RepID=UPI002611118B|nr:helix-turn-helix domain-containing protein [uncultured Roseovarius sp.]
MTQRMIRIGFLIFPGFPMSCLTSVIEPLRAANEISGHKTFAWDLVAESADRVMSSAGIAFEPSKSIEEMEDFDYLLLLAAPTSTFSHTRSPAHLRRAARHGTVLGAISGGVFPLLRSGAVGDEALSVHWCYETAFQAEFPDVAASDQVIEITPRCVTASGAAAAFDLALHMVETALGAGIATEVACWFQHPMMRKAGVQQMVPVLGDAAGPDDLPPLVARAIDLMGRNMEDPISMAEVAELLDITPRHLERSFKRATGQNPTGYFRAMRMKAARQIVMYSNDSMAEIAEAVGYASVKVFVRHYREAFGIAPRDDRQKINLTRVKGNLPVPSV